MNVPANMMSPPAASPLTAPVTAPPLTAQPPISAGVPLNAPPPVAPFPPVAPVSYNPNAGVPLTPPVQQAVSMAPPVAPLPHPTSSSAPLVPPFAPPVPQGPPASGQTQGDPMGMEQLPDWVKVGADVSDVPDEDFLETGLYLATVVHQEWKTNQEKGTVRLSVRLQIKAKDGQALDQIWFENLYWPNPQEDKPQALRFKQRRIKEYKIATGIPLTSPEMSPALGTNLQLKVKYDPNKENFKTQVNFLPMVG